MKQIDYLQEAVKLAKENPDARVHVCAASDELLDDYLWTAHEICKVEWGWWYWDNERIYTDVEDVRDVLENTLDREVSEEEAYSKMERAILIYTRAG